MVLTLQESLVFSIIKYKERIEMKKKILQISKHIIFSFAFVVTA